jgi:hypothetical protein
VGGAAVLISSLRERGEGGRRRRRLMSFIKIVNLRNGILRRKIPSINSLENNDVSY